MKIGQRLMIVEDNRGDAILLHRALKIETSLADITIVETAEAALERLRLALSSQGVLPHLMIVDLNLPGIGGLEFIKRCKADYQLRAVPSIVFSSSDDPVEVHTAYENGAAGYVRKPLAVTQYQHIAKCLASCWLDLMELPSISGPMSRCEDA